MMRVAATSAMADKLCGSYAPHFAKTIGWRDYGNAAVVVVRARRGLQVLAASKNLFLRIKERVKNEEEAGVAIEFKSPLGIVLYPDPRLRAKNKRVASFDQRLEELVQEMFEVMYRTDGVGLSAPQVGANYELMVFNPEGEKGKGKEYVFVNPKIIKYGKQRDIDREGCLSFPSILGDVERSISVRVEAQDIKGKKFATTFRNWTARIFQHEFDHLESVLYIDRMSNEVLNPIFDQLVNLEEDYEKNTGMTRPESIKDKLTISDKLL